MGPGLAQSWGTSWGEVGEAAIDGMGWGRTLEKGLGADSFRAVSKPQTLS